MSETRYDEWDAHWPSVGAWMQSNPAYRYRQRLIWSALNLPPTPAPLAVLDIGCGEGSFLRTVRALRPGARLAGLDGSREGVAEARKSLTGADIEHIDLENMPMSTLERLAGFATFALCSEVLEHLDKPIQVLSFARKLVAPSGALVVTVPSGPMSAFDRHVGHRKHYTAGLLNQEAEAAGWRVEEFWRAGFPFHTIYRLLVVARGASAIDDSKGESSAVSGTLSAMAFKMFDGLNRFNLRDGPFGWQIVARLVPRH